MTVVKKILFIAFFQLFQTTAEAASYSKCMTALRAAKGVVLEHIQKHGGRAAVGIGFAEPDQIGVVIREQDPPLPDTILIPHIVRVEDATHTLVDVLIGRPVFVGIVKPIPALITALDAIFPAAEAFEKNLQESFVKGEFPQSLEIPVVRIVSSEEIIYETFIDKGELGNREVDRVISFFLYFDPKLPEGVDPNSRQAHKDNLIPRRFRGISYGHTDGIDYPLFTKNSSEGRTVAKFRELKNANFLTVQEARRELEEHESP